jgi:hypothetical protein
MHQKKGFYNIDAHLFIIKEVNITRKYICQSKIKNCKKRQIYIF